MKYLIILLFALPAFANDSVRITGGTKGGGYDRMATNLFSLSKGLGYTPEKMTSKGAEENVKRIQAGEADVGFTQGDVLMANDQGRGVEILGVVGKECVHVAVNPEGKVTSEGDLQDKQDPAATIAVGKRGTGSEVTWRYMCTLEPAFCNSAAQYSGGTRTLGKVASGQLDAILFVTAPDNLNHRLVAAVNANDNLEFIDIEDWDLNDKLPNGEAVYTFEEIDTKDGWGGGVDTICTPLLVIANPEADETLLDDLANVVLTNQAAITQ